MIARRPLWLEDAFGGEQDEEAHARELREAIVADVCIVGGGYTGLWTAIRIKELEPDASVALVESVFCGHGPSGRNGGFALS